MSWSTQDPRLTYENTRGQTIVIVRPSPAGHYQLEAGVGEVETHNGYSVWTPFEGHRWIDAGEKWDPDWKWTPYP